MKQLARRMTHQLLINQIITEDETEIYDYGLQLILTAGTTTLVILLLGILLRQLPLTILFLLALVGLRHYAGGYHAQTYLNCFLISCGAFFSMLVFTHIATYFFIPIWGIMSNLAICVYLCYQGSINSEKQPKTEEQMKKRKWMTRGLACLFTVFSMTVFCKGLASYEMAWACVYVQALTALGMLVEQKKRKRKEETKKSNE